jgi:hypothetical protein
MTNLRERIGRCDISAQRLQQILTVLQAIAEVFAFGTTGQMMPDSVRRLVRQIAFDVQRENFPGKRAVHN